MCMIKFKFNTVAYNTLRNVTFACLFIFKHYNNKENLVQNFAQELENEKKQN